MKTETATLTDGQKIEFLPNVIGEGGFKRVHFSKDGKSVICFFKDQTPFVDPKQLERLAGLIGKYNPTLHPETGNYFSQLFCWPFAVIIHPMVGIVAPKYPPNFFFASGRWKGQEKNGKWFASPKLRKLLPPEERGNWKNYVELCTSMARGVRRMHLTGLAHSDLSCNNILIDPPNGRSVIIDVDSLAVPGVIPPVVAGTPGYIAPEVVATLHLSQNDPKRKLPCNYTDMYALAVSIYEYLLRRHPLKGPKVHHTDPTEDDRLSFGEKALFIEHPTDASNRPKGLAPTLDVLGPLLKAAFIKAFVTGLHDPTKRPTASEWESALSKTQDLLVPCANDACEEKWFVHIEGQPLKCPWCSTRIKTKLPILDFLYPPKPGQYRPELHRLVGYHKRSLFPWHIHTNIKNDERTSLEPQAEVYLHQEGWLLVNRKLPSLISPTGNPVPMGQACHLREGEEVLLSRDDKGRMIAVRMTA